MQITVDVSGWTQEEKNYLQAAAVSLLFQAGITYDDIWAKDGVIDITNPSADVSAILTTSNLKTFIATRLEENRLASIEAQKEGRAREAELLANELTNIKLAAIDAKIDTEVDAIQNLADAKKFLKAFLKKLTRYIIARS